MGAARQQVQADFRDDAVFADQRHDVGEGADRGDFDESRQPALAVRPAAQRLNELERDTDAGEVLVGIRAVVTLGIDDGERRGQLAIRLAKFLGATRIAGADRVASRLDVAKTSGATEVLDVSRAPISGSGAFDFVFVGPGKSSVIEPALEAVAPGGTLLAFTMAAPDERLAVSPHDLYFREVEIVPSYSAGPEEMREALALLSSRRIRVTDLVTQRFGIDRAREAFARAADPEGSVKVLLTFG